MNIRTTRTRRVFRDAAWCSIVIFSCLIARTAAADDGQPITDTHAAGSHTFRYAPPAGSNPQHVNVAGDFNNWSNTADELKRAGDVYEITLHLPEGVHYYKFVVDGKWTNDPASEADLEIDDNYGGKNSAVMIGPDGRHLPPAQPDAINAAAVAFDPADVRDRNVASRELLRLSLRTQADDVSSANVLVLGENDEWRPTPMWKTETSLGFDRFGAVLTIKAPSARYVFELKDGSATNYIASGKAYTSLSSAQAAAYSASMTPTFETPDWAKHAVWYQIFPERFRNGDPSNDPPNTKEWKSKWFSTLPGESGKFYNDVWSRRYGGDVQGIREALPYLRQLGINAIYLNPIFEAEDMHKYDTSDYRHVDDNFGVKGDLAELASVETDDPATWRWSKSDRIFLDFLDDAHRQGFKIIIDGVFNHVGRKHWAFQDVIKNGKNSKFASWFEITDWSSPSKDAPFHYKAWDGNDGALPDWKKDPQLGIAHGPREHILAITKRWLAPDGDPSRGVDGWRLDAANEVPHPFWVEWRKLVKSIKPDAYITGEIWSWAQPWLGGNEFDAVMNYRFATTGQDFFVNQQKAINCSQFNTRCNEIIFNYPFQVALVNQNLFDSHDTDRFASMFVNPDLAYDASNRIQDNGPQYKADKPSDEQRQRMLQAVAWQMTFVGAPMIYYGDEAGMWGPDDPSDRQPMLWKDLGTYDDPQEQFDQGKFDWYQRLIAIRAKLPALQTGFFHPVLIDNARGEYVYARDLGSQHVYVVLNRNSRAQTVEFLAGDHDAKLIDWLSAAQSDVNAPNDGRPIVELNGNANSLDAPGGRASVQLKPYGAAILTEKE
ncbi:MAG TPA: alpha amylase N-terminal ig-like domain-containing protein [Tepidisphaeraceae bacterium]|nr:alpha amylase N-terminal ig-like domain-containing protein [Tepidisphaeraceae bacterium]